MRTLAPKTQDFAKGWELFSRRTVAGMTSLFLLAACATWPGLDTEKRYGFEVQDVLQAIRSGEAREALSYYEKAATEAEARGLRLDAAKAHFAVAYLSYRIGKHQRGIQSGLRALQLLETQARDQEVLQTQAAVYLALGQNYRRTGDYGEAHRYFQEGLELAKAFPHEGDIQLLYARFLVAMGWLANWQGNFLEAIEHGRAALRSAEDCLAKNCAGRPLALLERAWSSLLLGNSHRRLGNLTEAEARLGEALRVAQSEGLQEVEAGTLLQLGFLAWARRDRPQAVKRFEQALALAATLNYTTEMIWMHAGIGWAMGNEDGLAAFKRSLAILEDLRGQLREPGLRSGLLGNYESIYYGAVWLSLSLGKTGDAFSLMERARARALLDLLGSQTVLSKGRTRRLVEEEVRLRAQLAEAQVLAQGELGPEGRARAQQEAENAQRAYRDFLDRVRRENAEQASLMTVEPLSLQEVQSLLPPGTTLLEYFAGGYETLIWVIDRQRVEVVRGPWPAVVYEILIQRFRQAIAEQASLEEVQLKALGLYNLLLTPARPHIRGERLLIVPHGVLHSLPFGALRTPEGRWLIEDYTISTLPSASVLKFLPEKEARAAAGTLAVGNPDVGPAHHLRYAEREARAVAERYPGATVLVRAEATEAKAKALGEKAGLLHFATHGELSEKDPLSSALLLVPGGNEDGRLEVREIFGLDLKARLVVLSACETGLGKLSKGDELVGLQRAFLYAGTPAVLTTLWKVDDRASYYLMEAFYDNLDESGPAAALRQAQLATMRDFPHPFAWAAFGLTGVPK